MTGPGSAGEAGGGEPLAGRRILITRPGHQAEAFAAAIRALGGEPMAIPLVRITDPEDRGALLEAAARVDGYDWIVFTSANAVTRFRDALREAGRGPEALAGVRTCAVGPATAAAVEDEGGRVDVVPAEYVGEGLVDAMRREAGVRGGRVLYPRAEGARPAVADGLRGLGASVDEVVAYRTEPDPAGAGEVRELLSRGEIDVVTFTSGSAVEAFVGGVGRDPGRALVATIGPITSRVARESGLEVAIEADPHTTEGLVAAIARWYREGGSG